MAKFTTLTPHIGDRPQQPYAVGETRELDDPSDIKHLTDAKIIGDYDKKAEDAYFKWLKDGSKPQSQIDAEKAEAERTAGEEKQG